MKDAEQRFWSFVNKQGRLMPGMLARCWEWQGCVDWTGYGEITIENRPIYVHRYSWELHHGKIPQGLMVHHICENKKCVNPRHLSLVTSSVHPYRHFFVEGRCSKGHPFDEENPLIDAKGYRRCRICAEESRQRYNERRRLKNAKESKG